MERTFIPIHSLLQGKLETESELDFDPEELLLLPAAVEVVATLFEPDPIELDGPAPAVAAVLVRAAETAAAVLDTIAPVVVVTEVLLVVPVAPGAATALGQLG